MSSFLSKFRGFPEYHMTIESLSSLRKNECMVIDCTGQVFADDGLPGYGKKQKESTKETIEKITAAGREYSYSLQRLFVMFEHFADDLSPLFTEEEDFKKWKVLLDNANAQAAKSKAAEKNAQKNLDKARRSANQSRISKAETELTMAQRKASDDAESAEESKRKLEEVQYPYESSMLEKFTTSVNCMLEKRIEAAREREPIIQKFREATATFVDYEDPRIQKYDNIINEFEEMLRNEFGVEPDQN
ncbi:hypothetical protein GPJ56_000643 [Histomonas meleagridis]|uniref:uncharacterized protein n=1 Tax=Histomonas meleagridis TaxID=135588 RepID=UPI003559718F|nr:hypothetical protein GPJ56_000643 [Histomonas meleagridis]KAH0804771.1 hypothetical protein GO595_002465 [Histomonas meleagridis]